MLKKLLNLPVWGMLLLLAGIAVVVLFVFSSLNPWNPMNWFDRPERVVDTSRTAVVREIQSLNQLETTSYTIEKIIEAGTDGNVFQDILYGDRLLLVAHGRVVAGVDMSLVTEDDVRISNNTLEIDLPDTAIFSTQLDNEQTKVYDRRQGIFSRVDKDLETEARQAAEAEITQAACDDSILQEAAENAQTHISKMYQIVGYDQVMVRVASGNCP